MYTKLSDAVLAKGTTDAYTPFVVKDGDVTLGTTPLVKQFNDTLVLVFEKDAMRVIKNLTDMATFVALVTDLRASKLAVQMPESVSSFMDPAARFAQYLESGETFGLNVLSTLPSEYQLMKLAFTTAFTPPTPPRKFAPELTMGARAQAWLDNKSNTANRSPCATDNEVGGVENLLRIGYKGGVANRLINGAGNGVSLKWAEAFWNRKLKDAWRNKEVSDETIERYAGRVLGYDVHVYADSITVGCNRISRAAIERVARILNWEM